MQVSLRADRAIAQWGESLGELDGCTIEDVTPETEAQINAAFLQRTGDGAVILDAGHNVSVRPPSQAWTDAQAAQAAADQALRDEVAAHPDPVVKELARRAGLI